MRPAEARRSASSMMSSSMRCSLVGKQVGWTRKTSAPRTFSSSWKWISPSEKRWNLDSPSGTPRNLQISSERGRLAEPEKILKRLSSESRDGLRAADAGPGVGFEEAPSFSPASEERSPGTPETRTGSAGAEPFSVLDGEFGTETAVVFCSLTLETPPGWLTY